YMNKSAYEALNGFFTEREDEVVEIEVLPPAIQPPDGVLMKNGLNLGVPKRTLALAFVEARQRFFASLKLDGQASKTCLEASRVILLFDPEHLTAANFRKRRLLCLKDRVKDGSGIAEHEEYSKSLTREIVFLDTILNSPLHRQSKSPTLWYHRAWLQDLLVPTSLTSSPEDRFLSVRTELNAVMKAGEQHPKNYYAWQYARRLFTRTDNAHHHSFLVASAFSVKAWCCKHPSDISGWAFLIFLLPKLQSVTTRMTVVKQVLEFATSLHFDKESLWAYLRTVLADATLEAERGVAVSLLRDYQKESTSTGAETSSNIRIAQTLRWIEIYSVPPYEPGPISSSQHGRQMYT
ncbi:hypothetical protein BDV95DRAFT_492149, partial [Massariosphaeria phaeospora]